MQSSRVVLLPHLLQSAARRAIEVASLPLIAGYWRNRTRDVLWVLLRQQGIRGVERNLGTTHENETSPATLMK